MSDCFFCTIVKGEALSVKVYEDESVYAFLDIQPNNLGHTLLIPKEHSRNIYDIKEDILCALAKVSKKISRAVTDAMDADGINITFNNGTAAGQIIFHTHIHIIPRFNGDTTDQKTYRDGELEETAKKIREELKR